MPAAFERCVKEGGRVRRFTLKGGKFRNICFKGNKSFPGEIKTKKKK